MKIKGLKIITAILFVIQTLLGLRSFMFIRSVFENQVNDDFSNEKLLLFLGFLFSFLISIIFIILIFNLLTESSVLKNIQNNDGMQSASTKKNKKDKEKQEMSEENREKKKRIISTLSADLETFTQLEPLTEKVLINISKEYDIMQGIFFVKDKNDKIFRKKGTYAYYSEDDLREFTEEVGLSGQVAINKKLLNISNIPEKYLTVLSGLGKSSPANLLILPVIHNNETVGIIELASFVKFDEFAENVLMEFSGELGLILVKLSETVNIEP